MRTLRIRDDGSYYSIRVDYMDIKSPKAQTEFVCTVIPTGYVFDIRFVPLFGKEACISVFVDKFDAPTYIRDTFQMVF